MGRAEEGFAPCGIEGALQDIAPELRGRELRQMSKPSSFMESARGLQIVVGVSASMRTRWIVVQICGQNQDRAGKDLQRVITSFVREHKEAIPIGALLLCSSSPAYCLLTFTSVILVYCSHSEHKIIVELGWGWWRSDTKQESVKFLSLTQPWTSAARTHVYNSCQTLSSFVA